MRIQFSYFLLFTTILLFCFLFIGISEASAQPKTKSVPIKLYFWPKDDDTFEMSVLVEVTRRIKPTSRMADAAIRELLKGVTAEEKAKGLSSAYGPDSLVQGGDCAESTMKPLLNYYIGVTIRKRVATVNFREPAMCYLNSTAAMQQVVKGPMEKTLLQFKTIKDWKIAINGRVVDEWDA